MWLKILRQNITQLARRAKGSASIEQKNGNGNNKANKTNNNGLEVNRNEEQNGSPDKSQAKKKPPVPGGGPLLQQTEISTSQLDFFRMLDEKIESGPDYDESADSPLRAEHVTSLMRRWELASASWSNMADLQNSNTLKQHPYHQQSLNRPLLALQNQNHPRALHHTAPFGAGTGGTSSYKPIPISAKDREGMRNIIGGRPDNAPIYVQRFASAARVDGLQDVTQHHYQHQYPSPNMPRHVLESISQSPTQSLKTPPGGVSSPTTVSRYQHYHHPDFQQPQQQYQPQQYQPMKYGKPPSALNGDYPMQQQPQQSIGLYRDRDFMFRQQQSSYDSPGPHALMTNSPSNPYVHKFQINASPGLQQPGGAGASLGHQQQQQQRKRGGYGPAQMT